MLQTLYTQESRAATSAELQARAQLKAATASLVRGTAALTELLTGEANELVEMLEKTEATSEKYRENSKDPAVVQRALNVSKQMVDLVNQVKSHDTAVQQSLAKTGDPLVYDDGSIDRKDIPDPGEQVGQLAEGIAKLAKKRGDQNMIKKTEGKLLQHVMAVDKMVKGAQEAEESGGDPREVLADAPEDDKADLVEALDADTVGTDTDEEETTADAWEVAELDVDDMDAFTRAKICDLLPSLRCAACGENASTLQEYRDCVGREISEYQNSRKRRARRAEAKAQMDETVQRSKELKNLKRRGMLLAHDAFEMWGVHRNWARWTSDPTWPLEALKGEPAKAGWESFTTDSQVILETSIQDFQTGAVDIAKEEGMASADTIYATHLEDHVAEAMDIKAGGEDLMARAGDLQQQGMTMMGDAEGTMAEAQAIQADGLQLQAEMQETSAALQTELNHCQQPPTPFQPSQCNPDEIMRLSNEMDGHRQEAEALADRSSALSEEMQAHAEEADVMAQEAQAMAADAEQLQTQAMALKDEALADLTSSETLQAVAAELQDCAQRIATRVVDLAAQTAEQVTTQILALVPDLFFACLEAALDIITGFGWIITAARVTYMLVKYAYKKYKEWRDTRKQQLCGKTPQLDCCVGTVMSWYDQQVLAQRKTEAEFRADSQWILARKLQVPNSCTPWSLTLFAEPLDDETARVILAREMAQNAPAIFTRQISTYSWFGVGKGSLRLKDDTRLVVARSSFLIEWPRKKRQKRARVLRWSTGCDDFLPLKGGSQNSKGLRAKRNNASPLGVRFKFGGGSRSSRSFDMASDSESMCFLANAMCRAACYKPEVCDEHLDPQGVVDLGGKAARNAKNLLSLCAPVSGLKRATGVEEATYSKETKVGPAALRAFVWDHLFHKGEGEPMSRTEALAYSAAVCDKHVLPFWSCGAEECSLCQGVASMYTSSQSAQQWCSSFHLKDSENVSETYARDSGRYFKCQYLSEYLQSTEDQSRLRDRRATVAETCESRTFCSKASNTLPTLDMRPGLQRGTPEYADSQCRMCVEFVQRAAAGLKPKAFCNAIPSRYPQQKIFCEGTLREMMEAIPGVKNAQEKAFWSGWFSEWSAGLNGTVCNKLCKESVERRPEIKLTLKNPSPLILAGEDTEAAPPGKPLEENWQPEAADSITKSPWMKRALKSVKLSLPARAVSGTQVVIWKLEDQMQSSISGWEALLKEIAWDGTFTQKRVWPRTGAGGVISQKVQQAVFLMLREVTLLRSHVDFIAALLQTKMNLGVARRTSEDLTRRMDSLVQNFDLMDEVLTGMKAPSVPSRLRRKFQKKARDMETVANCYGVIVERHEHPSTV
ncbi:GIP [Symbiodinium natans]|uniref:GIP protein n=1 Tax=Symbiodinium natans TaxID=878477 RepID=A0A812GKI2_9DINO|nr:GIP [Symbiodinium natans]